MGISPLPRKVSYFERDGKTKATGFVIKEVGVDETYEHGDFRKLIQLVNFDDGREYIRMGYYVKDNGSPESKFSWGSQTTFMLPKKEFQKLIEKARNEGII